MKKILAITMNEKEKFEISPIKCAKCAFVSINGEQCHVCQESLSVREDVRKRFPCDAYETGSYRVREVEMPNYMEARDIAYEWYREHQDAMIADAFIAGMAYIMNQLKGGRK